MHLPVFSGKIEFAATFCPRPQISHVMFDFDGTLSLIRGGWTEIMLGLFMELLPRRTGESDEALRNLLLDDILSLNGKPTIHQMNGFTERLSSRGVTAKEPAFYNQEYQARLGRAIEQRVAAIQSGTRTPVDFIVFGARAFLDKLKVAGMQLVLASGTELDCLRRESALLGIDRYFGQHIYGPHGDDPLFSKRQVIERLLEEEGIQGEQLLCFGDGQVEIENTREAGGLAVAVASDEAQNGSGRIDPWKRERLLQAGADVVIPDFRDGEALLACLLGKESART